MATEDEYEWSEDGIDYCIKQAGIPEYCSLSATAKGLIQESWHCGYCTFPKRPVVEKSYWGFLVYVPVHGGITFAEANGRKMTYGFDCNHGGDEVRPELQSVQWLKDECRRMATAIKIAAKHEPAYLRAVKSKRQKRIATVIDGYHKQLRELGMESASMNSVGAAINIITGNL